MDHHSYRQKIESEIVVLLEAKLRQGNVSAARAKEIAKAVLAVLTPDMSLDDIYRLVPDLDEPFQELANAVVPVRSDYHARVKEIVLPHAHKLIESGNLSEANQLFHKVKKREISVTQHG